MHKTGKKLLSILLALAMVFALLPGAALRAAADDVTYVQITSTPTAETLANMLTYDQEAALAIYNSAEFQAGAGPNGGIVLIFNIGEADGEYMIIHNAQGTPEVMSMALDTIGMLLQYSFNVYIVQPGGSEPPPTPSNPTVYYRYYTLNTADWSITPVVESTTNYTLLTSSNSNWNSGWYVVSGDVTINELVEFSGTVRLILCDGASLTVTEGISATAGGSKLIIYPGVMDSGAKAAPSIEGSGALHANASYPNEPGIGGDETLELEIHGGVIEATGGFGAAGIGGGYVANGGTVTIYGGSVTATGGSKAAGIGGAYGANGGSVSIYGGTVNAIGGENAAGIGAGYQGVSDGTLNFNSEGILLETSDDNLNWSPYAEGSPRGRYMRAQVQEEQPAAIPSADEGFSDDFEGEFTWTIQNGGQTNAWYLGEAVNNGGSKALYVSNDGGASNAYTTNASSFVFVEKTFSFEGGNYNFAYDWRGYGETTYDYIRMALIPVDFEVTAGSNYPSGFDSDSMPEGWIAIDGGAKLNLRNEWYHDVYEDVRVPAGLYRAAIIWRNDNSAGNQPAGAIDNFSIAPGSPYVPAPSLGAGCTDDFEGENTWTLANGDLENAWVVGEAVNNGGSKALYISNDGGESNTYNIRSEAFVYAYKTFAFDAGYYNVSYDWRVYGETTYDFLRVALIPNDVTIKAGTNFPTGFGSGSLPSGWIALDGGSKLNLQSEWQSFSKELIEVPAGEYRVAIIWRNDNSGGSMPPAAIDNFSLTPDNYTPVEGPVSADEGYTEDFEGINTWTLQNGELTNAWCVGDAVNNGGSKSLYVSKDGGFTNAYDIDSPAFVFADKLFRFDGGAYNFAYDWRCVGEDAWDYLRVALIPEDAEPVPGAQQPNGFSYNSFPSGWIPLDNNGQLVNQTSWQHLSIEGLEVPAGDYYVAFFWRNDDSIGSEIPAAIDNFSVTPVNYTPVEGPVSADEGYTEDFEGENTWKQGNEDQTNRWIVGEAVSNGGSKSLYISNDDSSHRYSPNGASFTFAEKAFSFAGGEYDFSYDWICNGEEDYDYLRVALVPESAVLTPGVIPSDFDISLPEDWIALDQGSFLCGSRDWQTMNLTRTAVPEGVYRVGFFWTNDPSVGNQPPAAIDNFSVEPHIDNPQIVDVYLIDQTNPEPSDVRIWAWGSAGDLASSFDARPAMEYQDSDAVVNREGVNGEPYFRPYYKFTLNVDDFGDGLLFTCPNGQCGNCALTDAQKEAGFAVFYLYYSDSGLGAGAGNDVWKLVSHTDADCTQPAIDEYRGLLTDESDSIERSPALGHDFSILLMEDLPTCTTGGFRLFQCSRCDETQTEALDPLDHTPGEPAEENVIPATCTEAGSYDLVVRCEICGEILESEPFTTEALGHDFGEWTVTAPATCTEAGEEVRICARCGETETQTLDALGHDYAAVVTEPSCTEGGFTTYTCSRCGDSYEDDFTEALGHDFGEWTVTAEPSCTEAGEEVRICARCGETETQTLDALGHQPGEPVIENYVEPTGSEAGGYDTVVYCQRCGEELSREHTALSSVDGPNADGYFYLGGEIVPCYQFVEWEGAWYFINDGDKYARDIHLDFKPVYVEGTPFEPGCYYFDAMGRLVIQNGPQANGYFYLNGIRQKAYQLIEWNGDYYFINDAHKYARNIRLYLGQQFVAGSELAPGYYDFDDSGKLVIKNGPWEDGYFYINGARQSCYQLILWEGGYYFINDGHKYAVNKRIYLSAQYIGDEPISVGYHYFGADGRMIQD